ncbi:MAG TPA: Ku protein [Thermoanaerobaculia bacterium]|nr:Ku protein [Thermoanaerobaculia bacterium]
MAEELEDVEEGSAPGGIRSFWTGTITFGLVTVPVALYAATRSGGTALRMVGPDGATVERRYICSKDEKELDADDIVRGYAIEKDKYVVVTDEELEAIEPRKSREIDLQLFVDADALDPVYFERGYFLVPSGGSNKAYRLLAEVMEKKGYAGIATFVMRAKEYLVAILAEDGILRAETLRFHDEVRTPEQIGLPKKAKATAADVKKFESQIAKKSRKLDPGELLDDYEERLEKLVAAKQRKGEDVIRAPEGMKPEEPGAEVVDLLAVLSRSLGGGTAARKPPRRASKRAAMKKKKRA